MATIDPEDIQAIAEATARRTVELLRNQPADPDPWFTLRQAEAYLNVTRTMFYRMRQLHGEALKPCSEHALRWSKVSLDVFKLSRSVTLPRRRGRKPKNTLWPPQT